MKPSALLLLSLATLAVGQRPFFAGLRPIGIPEVTTEALADRFGVVDGTTQRLPVEANGDRDLIDRLSKLPIDKQPFWFINWQALEAHRQKPQTYPQKPNVFVDPPSNGASNANFNSNFNGNQASPNFGQNPNTGNLTPNFGNQTPSFGNQLPSSGIQNPNFGNQSPNSGNQTPNTSNQTSSSSSASSGQNIETSNRFGVEEYPKNKDKKESSIINSNLNPGYGKPVPLESLDKKKAPPKDTYYESYRF